MLTDVGTMLSSLVTSIPFFSSTASHAVTSNTNTESPDTSNLSGPDIHATNSHHNHDIDQILLSENDSFWLGDDDTFNHEDDGNWLTHASSPHRLPPSITSISPANAKVCILENATQENSLNASIYYENSFTR